VSLLGSGSCREDGFVEAISPDAIGEDHPSYHYFKGVCMAYWGEQATLFQKLAFTSHIEYHIEQGMELSHRYEGAGILRLAAGLYSNPQTQALGIYDVHYAKEAIDSAVEQQAYPGDPSDGSQYYDNWNGMVQVLRQLHADEPDAGWEDEAIATCEEILGEMDYRIEEDDLPSGREAEFKFNYNKIKEWYKEMTGQDW